MGRQCRDYGLVTNGTAVDRLVTSRTAEDGLVTSGTAADRLVTNGTAVDDLVTSGTVVDLTSGNTLFTLRPCSTVYEAWRASTREITKS